MSGSVASACSTAATSLTERTRSLIDWTISLAKKGLPSARATTRSTICGALEPSDVANQLRDRIVLEGLKGHGDVVPPASSPSRAPIEQPRTGEGDHRRRRIAPGLHDDLHEIEETVTRPVQILEDQDERRPSRRHLDGRAPRRKEGGPVDHLRFTGADGRGEEIRRTLG